MKKKILCLVCALLMVLTTVLTGCQKLGGQGDLTGDVIDKASDSTITLSMHVVCKQKPSEETAKLVTEEFNKITKSKFKTQVVLHWLTYDEYYETIEAQVVGNDAYRALQDEANAAFKKAKKEAKAWGIDTDRLWADSWYAEHPDYAEFRETEALTGEDTTAEETVMVTVEGADGYQIPQLKYPEEKKFQLDILWIDSFDRYQEYIAKDWITRLDDELTGASKKLKEYISPSLLSWVKWYTNGTYAIPNNCAIGEYTYLLLNKKYVDKYHHTTNVSKIKTVCDEQFKNYLNDVSEYEKSVVPIAGDIPVTNVLYWNLTKTTPSSASLDTSKFSIMGEFYTRDRSLDPTKSDNAPMTARNLFITNNDFTAQLRAIQSYKDAKYIIPEAEAAGKEFAAKVVKGGYELQEQYADDYYIVTLEKPRISEDDLFSNMFAVSSFTRSLSRSMEIVTYLNTNAELRNILQYGVQGVHYTVDGDGVAHRIKNASGGYDYLMDIKNTGNVFLAYPEEGMDPNVWTYAKKQNLDALPGLLNCFRLGEKNLIPDGSEGQAVLNYDQIEQIQAASEKLEKDLAAVQSLDELEELLLKVSSDPAYAPDAVKTQASAVSPSSLYYIYFNQWVQEVGLTSMSEG